MTDIEITQADREAAANLTVPNGRWPGFSADFRSGRADRNQLTQAFARHRIEARAAAIEECAKVAEDHRMVTGYITYAETVATAIRALEHTGQDGRGEKA